MSAVTDHLRDQLIAEKAYFKYDYGTAALDPWLTDQLTGMLEKVGVNDLRYLAHFSGTIPMQSQDGLSIDYVQTSYFYNALTGKAITGLGTDNTGPGQIGAEITGYTTDTDIFAITHNSDYVFTYHCQFVKPGFPVFTVQLQHITKEGSILSQILPVVMVVVSLTVPGLGTAIGQAALGIFGPAGAAFASTYPALATMIGNTAISAATNGGDIEKAVTGGIAGFAGAQFGGIITNATDIPALGRAAAAATSTAITGGNVTTALGMSLAQSGITTGAKAMGDFLSTDPTQVDTSFQYDYSFDPSAQPFDFTGSQQFDSSSGVSVFDPLNSFSTDLFSSGADINAGGFMSGGIDYSWLDNSPLSVDMSGVSLSLGDGTTTTAGDVQQPASTDSSGVNWDQVISSVSQVAIAALKILPAFQTAGRPPVRVGSTASNSDGSTTTYSANGTMTTHYPNGQVVTRPTPTGQPYFMADGSTVTNNGDGTYTVIRPDGKAATMKYGSALGGNTGLLLAAAAVGAIVLLK